MNQSDSALTCRPRSWPEYAARWRVCHTAIGVSVTVQLTHGRQHNRHGFRAFVGACENNLCLYRLLLTCVGKDQDCKIFHQKRPRLMQYFRHISLTACLLMPSFIEVLYCVMPAVMHACTSSARGVKSVETG